MATHCFIPILGKRMRATALTQAGGLLAGGTEDAVVATDGFISVNLTSEIEEGTEIITRKASGALCVNEKQADSFKRFTMEMEFCGVNPSLLSIVSNAEPYLDSSGDVAGFTVPEGELLKRFALELWSGLSGAPAASGDEEPSGYFVLPHIQSGVLSDITIDGENAITFGLTGAFTRGGNAWGTGPFDVVYNDADVASPLPTALDPFDHLLLMDTALAPPPSACDPLPMPV